MKTLVIVAHPHIEKSVINKRWIDALTGQVTIHQLYAAYPQGTPINVAHEQALVEKHDRIIFQYPLYWYAAPALLKEWIDSVFTDGWAYGAGGDAMVNKEIGVAVSCGGKELEFSARGNQCHPLTTYLSVYDGIAAFARARYIGFHAVYDTYNPQIQSIMEANCQEYIRFATAPYN